MAAPLSNTAIVIASASAGALLDTLTATFPHATIIGAVMGALIPALFLEPEPIQKAARLYLGAVLLALLFTGGLLAWLDIGERFATALAAALSAFARDIHALVRGQLPPIVDAVRTRLVGGKGAQQ